MEVKKLILHFLLCFGNDITGIEIYIYIQIYIFM